MVLFTPLLTLLFTPRQTIAATNGGLAPGRISHFTYEHDGDKVGVHSLCSTYDRTSVVHAADAPLVFTPLLTPHVHTSPVHTFCSTLCSQCAIRANHTLMEAFNLAREIAPPPKHDERPVAPTLKLDVILTAAGAVVD